MLTPSSRPHTAPPGLRFLCSPPHTPLAPSVASLSSTNECFFSAPGHLILVADLTRYVNWEVVQHIGLVTSVGMLNIGCVLVGIMSKHRLGLNVHTRLGLNHSFRDINALQSCIFTLEAVV